MPMPGLTARTAMQRAWRAALAVVALGWAVHEVAFAASWGQAAEGARVPEGDAALAVPHFSLHDLMADDEFADTEFIVLSQQEKAHDGAERRAATEELEVHTHGDAALHNIATASGSGVVCETVCRPRTSTSAAGASFVELDELEDAPGGADAAKALQQYVRKVVETLQQNNAAQLEELALAFNRSLCEATGGGWSKVSAACAPFLRASPTMVSSCEGGDVFEACNGGFRDANGVVHDGTAGDYVPCNPFQALALSHTQHHAVPQQVHARSNPWFGCRWLGPFHQWWSLSKSFSPTNAHRLARTHAHQRTHVRTRSHGRHAQPAVPHARTNVRTTRTRARTHAGVLLAVGRWTGGPGGISGVQAGRWAQPRGGPRPMRGGRADR